MSFLRRSLFIFICFLLILCSLPACERDPEDNIDTAQTRSESFYDCFDTVSTVISYRGDSADDFRDNYDAVYALLKEYHSLFDIYYEYSQVNNLKTINDNAGISPVKVDRKLIDFLLYAKKIHADTNGATNVAMGSVLKLWHDAREVATEHPEDAYVPSGEELSRAAEHTDINDLIIDEENSTVFLADPLMRLDVGALGKGYATEKAAQLLMQRGVTSYVLNVGGNIRAIGAKASGEGWITGITNPDKSSSESFACRVTIKDVSLVTSGDYERYFIADGNKYHHIIDPKTNMPADYFSSVSVFTADSALADALSTALFCMSYEDGLELIEAIGGTDAVWVRKDGTVIATPGVNIVD